MMTTFFINYNQKGLKSDTVNLLPKEHHSAVFQNYYIWNHELIFLEQGKESNHQKSPLKILLTKSAIQSYSQTLRPYAVLFSSFEVIILQPAKFESKIKKYQDFDNFIQTINTALCLNNNYLMSYASVQSRQPSSLRKNSFADRPESPYNHYAEKSKYLKDNSKSYISNMYSPQVSYDIPNRTRNVMGDLDNIHKSAFDKFQNNFQTKQQRNKPRSQMIENLQRMQTKIKGILGQN